MQKLFDEADITINGTRPHDIQIHNEDFYQRIFKQKHLGVGESYMEGWWDCEALDQFTYKVVIASLHNRVKGDWKKYFHFLKSKLFNLQKTSRAFQVGEEHYDVGNDLYKAMLDKRMLYTSAYWKNASNLDDAQEAKLDLICRKIKLEPGMTVLELGCGFGSFAKFAAEKYGVKVTGLTISKEQAKLGKELCRDLPVEIRLDDYRNATGKYDRVISIGIMEHIGYKNYRTYMEKVHETLTKVGIAFVHTIGINASYSSANRWTTKYIFPNSMLPSISQLGKSMEKLLVMEDWHNFGEDYDKTLMAWHENLVRAWPDLKAQYSERFFRMWQYYLLTCAGAFRARELQLWQIVMTKPGNSQPQCRIS